ncbi:MAG TPA: LPS export ABC transporter periplasmic protein LptC [Paenalcaligenes sp.]|nr:LPS export ABC transporter periplasmic protein LptC [Paenalcaligenes sp.]
MRDRLPSLITVALLITLVAGTWWSAHYTMSTIEIDPPRKLTHEPDAWADDFIMLRTDSDGAAINRLEGDYFEHYPDDDSYFIVEAVATGIRPDRPITIGRSDEAVMDDDGARITMQGNAHVHRVPTQDRAALDIYSDVLVIFPDDDVVETDEPAHIVDGRSTLDGIGMHYANATRQLQVFSASNVKLSGQDRQERRTQKQQEDTQP